MGKAFGKSVLLSLVICGIIIVVALVFISVNSSDGFGQAVTASSTLGATLVLCVYAFSTHKLRRASEDSSEFDVFMRLILEYNSEEGYDLRKAMYNEAGPKLMELLIEKFGDKMLKESKKGEKYLFDSNDAPEIRKKTLSDLQGAVNSLSSEEKKEYHDKLHSELDKAKTSYREFGSLKVIESVLLSMDLVSAPAFVNNRLLDHFVEQWTPVLRKTATILLPFVIVEGALRGEDDKYYKCHYLRLIQSVGVFEEGDFKPPEIPPRRKRL